MKTEVIAFYKIKVDPEKNYFRGSAHIYIEELDIDLRGVHVVVNQGKFWVELPFLEKYNFDEKKKYRFPVIQFANREKTLSLRKSVIKSVTEYVKKNV